VNEYEGGSELVTLIVFAFALTVLILVAML
jgi:hypothetical protein